MVQNVFKPVFVKSLCLGFVCGLFLLCSNCLVAGEYYVSIYRKATIQECPHPNRIIPMATGTLSICPQHLKMMGLPDYQGETATLLLDYPDFRNVYISEHESVWPPEPLYIQSSGNGFPESNIPGIRRLEESGMDVLDMDQTRRGPDSFGQQGTTQTGTPFFVRTERVFRNIADRTLARLSRLSRRMFVSKATETQPLNFMSIEDKHFTGADDANPDRQEVGDLHYSFAENPVESMELHTLIRELINSGEEYSIPENTFLRDNLFCVLPGNRVEFSFTESSPDWRNLKMVVYNHRRRCEYIISVGGTPERASSVASTDSRLPLSSSMMVYMHAHHATANSGNFVRRGQHLCIETEL